MSQYEKTYIGKGTQVKDLDIIRVSISKETLEEILKDHMVDYDGKEYLVFEVASLKAGGRRRRPPCGSASADTGIPRDPFRRRSLPAGSWLGVGVVLFGLAHLVADMDRSWAEAASVGVRVGGALAVARTVLAITRQRLRFRFLAGFSGLLLAVVLLVSVAIGTVIDRNLRQGAFDRLAGQADDARLNLIDLASDEVRRLVVIGQDSRIADTIRSGDAVPSTLVADLRDQLLPDVDFVLFLDRGGAIRGRTGLPAARAVEVVGTEAVDFAIREATEVSSLDALSGGGLALLGVAPIRPRGATAPAGFAVAGFIVGEELLEREVIAGRGTRAAAYQGFRGSPPRLVAAAGFDAVSQAAAAAAGRGGGGRGGGGGVGRLAVRPRGREDRRRRPPGDRLGRIRGRVDRAVPRRRRLARRGGGHRAVPRVRHPEAVAGRMGGAPLARRARRDGRRPRRGRARRRVRCDTRRTCTWDGRMSERPEHIGKYAVRGEIGRGSQAVVYLCEDPFIGREVAVKLFTPQSSEPVSNEMRRKMFFNEARTAGKLRHPNILPIMDAGEEGDRWYLVMEYLKDAKPLNAHTRPETLLPVPDVIKLMFKAARALDFAHRHGVVHRDIKPGNMLLTAAGELYICDFGVALDSGADTTEVGGVMGSPSYMAPEQAQGERVSGQADIFSLGVVMYELLAGRRPFRGNSLSELISQIVNNDPEPPSLYRAEIPELVDRVVARALSKSVKDRYQSALDLATELSDAGTQLERLVSEVAEQERYAMVSELSFFQDFSYEETWELLRASDWVQASAGQVIVNEGDVDDCFYVLITGEAGVWRSGKRFASLAPGDCFGEMALVKMPRTASIGALAPSSLLKVRASRLEQLSASAQLKFTRVFLRTLVERLARSAER
jgi:eukaryotic-like serine/threonine-protein kinase